MIKQHKNKWHFLISLFFRDRENQKKIIPNYIDTILLVFAIILFILSVFKGFTSVYFGLLVLVLGVINLLGMIENVLLKEKIKSIVSYLGITIVCFIFAYYKLH
ncbi:hypothetical protein [Metabacillus litoralis]|uniref:hypothetical protein n=1 Tax=Metabacillus litoralis TaxID=152268 RepID=UPI001CFDF5A6|nr:hypothetical protein [Metabacillus litoralis]